MATTTERGYGAKHQAERRRIQRLMTAGQQFPCSRTDQPYCPHTPVDPTNWELDHTDDRTGFLGPAHPACNRHAGIDKAYTTTRGTGTTMITRDWS